MTSTGTKHVRILVVWLLFLGYSAIFAQTGDQVGSQPAAGEQPAEAKRMSFIIDVDGSFEQSALMSEPIATVLSYYTSLADYAVLIRFTAPVKESEANRNVEELRTIATRYAIDTLMYVTVGNGDGDRETVTFGVFESAADEYTALSSKTIDSAQLGEYDELHDLISTAYGHILDLDDGWGALRPVNRGETGTYATSVDGIYAGKALSQPIAVPVGEHIVLLEQKRPLGTQILAEQYMTFREAKSTAVEFAIPALTDLERSAFERLEQTVRNQWNTEPSIARSRIESALGLLEKSSASTSLEELADRFARLSADLESGATPSDFPNSNLLTIRDPTEFDEEENARLIKETDFSDAARVQAEKDAIDTENTSETVASTDTDETSTTESPATDTTGNTSAASEGNAAESTDRSGSHASEVAWEDSYVAAAMNVMASRIREEGLLGPLFWSEVGSIFAAAGQVVIDLGLDTRLYSAKAWDASDDGWGPLIDNAENIWERVTIDFGGNYPYFALGAGAGQAVTLVTQTAVFPYRKLRLSSSGRLIYSLGTLLDLGGTALAIYARNLALEAVITERSLDDSTQGSQELWETYRTQYSTATIARFGSYFAMGSGVAVSLTAAAATGNARRVVSGTGQMLLFNTGSILATTANLAAYLSILFRIESEHHWDRYTSTGDAGAYTSYNESLSYFRYATIASYGLLGGAAIGWITAILLPPILPTHATTEIEEMSFAPYLHATADRVTLGASIKPRF